MYGEFLYTINQYQKELNTQAASYFRTLDEQGLYGSLIIIAIAFIYGIIHAAGLGHGKAVIASYFLS
ncbi:MAG: nickel/cobalt transporter (NicO) family protein, partial [Campylobacterota bacterium]|nr:nickel/cobalt transporter (NicO) family protein [Campylobacterota bacterium]